MLTDDDANDDVRAPIFFHRTTFSGDLRNYVTTTNIRFSSDWSATGLGINEFTWSLE